MNYFCIKPHIPEGEYGFTLPSLDSSVSITIPLLHSLPELSLSALLTAALFHAPYNEGGPLQIFRLVSYFLLSWFILFKPPLIASTPEQWKANKQVTLNDKTRYTLKWKQSTLQIHNFTVKHHIPKCEDVSVLSSSRYSISVAKSLFASLPSLSLSGLISAAGFYLYSNVRTLHSSKLGPSLIFSVMLTSDPSPASSHFSNPSLSSYEFCILSLSQYHPYLHQYHYMNHSHLHFIKQLLHICLPLHSYVPRKDNKSEGEDKCENLLYEMKMGMIHIMILIKRWMILR